MCIQNKKTIVICFLLFIFSFLAPNIVFSQATSSASMDIQVLEEPNPPVQKDEFVRAQVVSVISEKTKEEYSQTFLVQELKVRLLHGNDKGKEIDLMYETDGQNSSLVLKPGQKVVLGVQQQEGGHFYYISDVYRLNAVWLIALFFIFMTLLLTRGQGIRAFLGLIASFLILFFVVIPLMLKGYSPFVASLIGCFGIVCTSLYIAHGFRVRTNIAFVSIVLTLSLSAFFSWLFVWSSKMTGLGTEEAFFLKTSEFFSSGIDIRGLLLAGFLIGTLGVLDDVATAQSATVEELHKANPKLNFSELYTRGLSVGKEHIISLVNTLILAYTGASFPLILLFSIYEKPLWVTLNSEIIMEEILRMLAGSTALILAVPITTFLAAWIFGNGGKFHFDKSN